MSATVTVTGKVGPGETLTAQAFTGVTSFTFDCTTNILSFVNSNGATTMVDITDATTITATKSGSTYTLTVS